MRKPSIHIVDIALRDILEDVLDIKINDAQVLQILSKARKYALSHRKILVSNEKQQRQANNITKSSLNFNVLMAKTIFLVRKTMKHRGIDIAKPGTSEFTLIKTITKNAVEFKDLFFRDDKHETAFREYIILANKKMKKFNLTRISSMHSSLIEEYEAIRELKNDKFPEFTDRAYKAYNKRIINKVGVILNDYKNNPDKFKYFMRVAERCKELKITPEIYIDAQFDGLAWANGIPDPMQLVGDKSNERLEKYLFENDTQLKDVNKEAKDKTVSRLKDILNRKK